MGKSELEKSLDELKEDLETIEWRIKQNSDDIAKIREIIIDMKQKQNLK